MALSRASSVHPVESMRAPAPEVKKRPAKRPAKRAAVRPVPETQVDDAIAVTPEPSTTKTTRPPTAGLDTSVKRSSLTLPALPDRADAPVSSVTRRTDVSLRRKRETALLLPVTSLDLMLSAFKDSRAAYRQTMAAKDPGGEYRLTRSAFLGQALDYALDHPGEWVDAIPNDARNEPATRVPRKQIGMHWPVELIERFHGSWELLDAEVQWPAGFTLTKANLAGTGILWSLTAVDTWLASVPNDDRFSEPVAGDGRLRTAEEEPRTRA